MLAAITHRYIQSRQTPEVEAIVYMTDKAYLVPTNLKNIPFPTHSLRGGKDIFTPSRE